MALAKDHESMIDEEAYKVSNLDWDRLRAYADRVAKNTTKPLEKPISYTNTEFKTVKVERSVPRVLWLKPKIEVSEETQEVNNHTDAIGPHWIVESRKWLLQEKSRVGITKVEETSTELFYIVLLPSGLLRHLTVKHNEVLNFTQGKLYRPVNDTSHTVRDLTEEDVVKMDYDTKLYIWGPDRSGRSGETNRECGKRLIRHSKGVGINLALKRILES